MKTRLIASLMLLMPALLCAQSDIQPLAKKRSDGTLLDGFKTGAKTLTISALGTLEWVNGGTMTGASYFRTAAGLGIGVNVQAYDDDLDVWAGITPTGDVQILLGAADNAAMRTALGLVIGTNVQAYNANLTTYAGITPSANVQSLLGAADYAGARTLLGLVIGTNVQAYDADLTTWAGITPDGSVSAALPNAVNASGGLLTYGMIGTSGAKLPLLNASNTFGAAQNFTSTLAVDPGAGYPQFTATGYTGNGFRVASDRVDFWVGGAIQCTFQAGVTTMTSKIAWPGSLYLNGGNDEAGRLVQNFGTSPQAFSLANTYTSFYNKEEVEIGWSSDVAHLWTLKGLGGGSARDLILGRDQTEKMRIGANTTDHVQPVKLKSYIVSGLPSASTCGEGSMAWVTDATATTAYSTVAGGGSNKVMVISDGTNWIIH